MVAGCWQDARRRVNKGKGRVEELEAILIREWHDVINVFKKMN